MKNTENPNKEAIKEAIVEKLYYRWSKETVLEYVISKFNPDKSEIPNFINLIDRIEIEITKMRLNVGKIK